MIITFFDIMSSPSYPLRVVLPLATDPALRARCRRAARRARLPLPEWLLKALPQGDNNPAV